MNLLLLLLKEKFHEIAPLCSNIKYFVKSEYKKQLVPDWIIPQLNIFILPYSLKVSKNICNEQCPGDKDESCGGYDAMNLFEVKSFD